MKICFFGVGGVGGYFGALVTKGKVNEGDFFGGTIIRLGNKMNIPVPTTKEVYSQFINNFNGQN